MTPWELKAREFVSCNCAYGCPCQFNALPTHGQCEACAGFLVDEGSYGGVDLKGVIAGALLWWPGPIHLGGGKVQPFVDVRASEAQRNAMLKIMSGEDTDPGATVWAVFATTMVEAFDPIFAPIELEVDVDKRISRLKVDGLVDARSEPIRNPVTGEEHRARINLPNGFEYTMAEMASATTKTQGKIKLDFNGTYAQIAHIHLNNHGVVHA